MEWDLKKDLRDLSIICVSIVSIILLVEFISRTFNLSPTTVMWNVMGVFYFVFMGVIMVGMAKSMKEPIQNMKKDIDAVNKYYDELEEKEKQDKEDK